MTMELFKVSQLTGEPHTMTLPLTERVYGILYNQWKTDNRMIQDVFYMLTPEQREFIMTGTTTEEWDSIMENDE